MPNNKQTGYYVFEEDFIPTLECLDHDTLIANILDRYNRNDTSKNIVKHGRYIWKIEYIGKLELEEVPVEPVPTRKTVILK